MADPARPPTMEDVAAEAGVSRALVSLVMRGSPKVSEARRAAVHEAADRLGYRPNAVARSLAERRSNTIGVVISDLHNVFFSEVVDGINDQAELHGYRLLLNTARRNDDDERRAIEAFLEYRVDAVLVLGSRAPTSALQEASETAPVVSIGSVVEGIDVVVNDDERGAELVVEHLTELGHRDIVHVDGGNGGGAESRRRGFVGAMEALGLQARVVAGDYTEASGTAAVETLLGEGSLPTAIFAANDLAALGALSALEDAGLSVPGDVSVVGYDNTALAALGHVGLTTVNQPRQEMGRVAVSCALERLDEGRRASVTHVLEPSLVARRTTGTARGG